MAGLGNQKYTDIPSERERRVGREEREREEKRESEREIEKVYDSSFESWLCHPKSGRPITIFGLSTNRTRLYW